jgi:molybdopterin converting factor small subunit
MIQIKVKIFSQAIPDYFEIELDDGSSVETLLTRVRERVVQESSGSGSHKIAFLNNTGSLVVLLNGLSIYALSGWKTTLQEGDEVSLLPMVAGG